MREPIGAVLADPPGPWPSAPELYAFLSRHVGPGARTLETGCGASTVLLAAWGAEHTCVTPSEEEVERCLAWCATHGIGTGAVRFTVGLSQDVLPGLGPDPLDLVLVDGAHGFPLPILDWFYAAGRLRGGGILVLDDVHLPHVAVPLLAVLDGDPRWTALDRGSTWAAYRREGEGPLGEEWTAQPFLRTRSVMAHLARAAARRATRR